VLNAFRSADNHHQFWLNVSVSVWVGWKHKATHARRPFSDLLSAPTCFISPVVRTPVKVQYLTYSNLIIITWFHKNVSNEICILLTHLPCLFLFIIVYIRPTGTGEFSSHHQQSPMWVEGKHTTGCCPVLRRDLLRHCYHHLIAMQPSARCHTPWLRRTTALSAVPRLYPLHD
jgi:hypothetical protein